MTRPRLLLLAPVLLVAILAAMPMLAQASGSSYIGQFHHNSVIASTVPSNGMALTAKAGCLIVLDSGGHAVETFSGGVINGPWDMTASDNNATAALFFTNVLNGTVAASPKVVNKQTVVRMVLNVPNQGNG